LRKNAFPILASNRETHRFLPVRHHPSRAQNDDPIYARTKKRNVPKKKIKTVFFFAFLFHLNFSQIIFGIEMTTENSSVRAKQARIDKM